MMKFAMATFAAVNIYLDAWIKHTNFSFIDTFIKQRKLLGLQLL
jgi:hypothetical protein